MAFWDNIHFPYFNMQELNLDWIMKELKRIAGFMPQDGNVGDILTRKSEGAVWEPPEAVNININALPEDTEIGDNDQLIFYDISAQANRKIKPPNLLDSMMSNGTPLMDGTASPGTSKKPARYDHKHPTDTSRAPADYFQNGNLKFEHGGLNDSGPNYCKMPDGTLMCWGNVTAEGTNERSWGSLIIKDFPTITFPISFITPPDISVSATGGAALFMVTAVADTGNINSIQLARATAFPAAVSYAWMALGRWK